MKGPLLIANRGEIARRILRTARRMGVPTVAVYSDADAGALHVSEADAAVRIGPPPARESYLNAEAILDAARQTGAGAIHPGYGFLSENADFAEAVAAAGLTWVGPPPAAIRAMGMKDAARARMVEAGVPVTPGWHGVDQDPGRLAEEAARLGYPVLIKAAAGGGGKGMRRVDAPEDFAAALAACRREAAAGFGEDRVILERYAASPRHIEVQVFADRHGQVVHLFERDCSLQRRHQKVVEIAPAPGMTEDVRQAVCEAAARAAQAVAYEGAGTVEFIADASDGLRADRIWFMEMNTRLQVEHPVTEAITGIDLVEWQLRVADGEPLPLRQDQITRTGWAVEARLYAEDPAADFLPSTGRLEHFRLPQSVRVDAAVTEGDLVSPHYDPMIAKLVAHADSLGAAAGALAGACRSVEVWPVRTNAGFLARCLERPETLSGVADTGFIAANLDALATPPQPDEAVFAAAANTEAAAWTTPGPAGFRLNASARRDVLLFQNGEPRVAIAAESGLNAIRLADDVVVFKDGDAYAFQRRPPAQAQDLAAATGRITTPIPGRVAAVMVAPGDRVTRGQAVAVVEAMKMEHSLTAPFDGAVETVSAAPGDQVDEGATLVTLRAD